VSNSISSGPVAPGNLTLQVAPDDTETAENMYVRLLNWRMALLRWGQAMSAAQGILYTSITVSATQIKASLTTPIEIIPPPTDPTKTLVLVSSFYRYTYGTVGYGTVDANFGLWYEGGIGISAFDGEPLHSLMLAGSSSNMVGISALTATPTTDASTSGKGVTLASTATNPTLGDGSLTILLAYALG
jgi:hypothetical protein